jgi:xanthine dehydrogenase YagT iron-sulfur-binding subunit
MKSKNAFSRRGFLQGAGIGGAIGTGLLEKTAEGAPAGASVAGPGAVEISLTINGKAVNLTVEPRVTLIDALRDHLDLTGAKRVCDRGTCGACTVLMNGKAVYSCSILAIDAQGKSIETIEGMGGPEKMHPVSQAFFENDAQQCGYCTSGFVVACKGFLEENPDPTEDDVKHGLGGNLCRCGTYMGVRAAAMQAAVALQRGKRNG